MSEIQFFQTRMGRAFYEHTMPELVRQITRMNELLEKMTDNPQSEKSPEQPESLGGPMNE